MNDQQGNESKKIHLNIIKLRAFVGYLGEKSQHSWWDTNFLSETGRQFLSINFPRSSFSAGVNSVSTAARRLHDERIGKGGVYHLFRLPIAIEENLHGMLLDFNVDVIIPDLSDTNAAMDRLEQFMGNGVSAPAGPVQIGTMKNILNNFSIQELAAHYLDAFNNKKQCFPYFSAE